MQFTKNELPILVIIGPSGAGKSTIIRKLFDDGYIKITPTWTTRAPRPGENELGIEHKFVSEKLFEQKEAQNYFLETVQLFGLPYKYGLPRIESSRSGKIRLVMLRAPLMSLFKKYYDNYIIYQIEDSLTNVKNRLLDRKLMGEELGTRIDDFTKEVKMGQSIADRVFVNTSIDKLYKELTAAIKKDFVRQ